MNISRRFFIGVGAKVFGLADFDSTHWIFAAGSDSSSSAARCT